MDKIERLKEEIQHKEQEIYGLQEQVNALIKEEYSGLVGRCYRVSEASVMIITEIGDVGSDYVRVFIQRVDKNSPVQGRNLTCVPGLIKYNKNQYEEITKEEFCEFFIKSTTIKENG